jgi:hypothetical protein
VTWLAVARLALCTSELFRWPAVLTLIILYYTIMIIESVMLGQKSVPGGWQQQPIDQRPPCHVDHHGTSAYMTHLLCHAYCNACYVLNMVGGVKAHGSFSVSHTLSLDLRGGLPHAYTMRSSNHSFMFDRCAGLAGQGSR